MNFIYNFCSDLKNLAACLATFATAFTLTTSPDTALFMSNYFAGVATGVALMMFVDSEEGD